MADENLVASFLDGNATNGEIRQILDALAESELLLNAVASAAAINSLISYKQIDFTENLNLNN